jgi:glycosyltransferase involved in cell wall biosynthesis
LLIDCLESFIKQSYPNWQLCLADDKPTQLYVREVLETYQAKDKRISVVFRENKGQTELLANN